MDRLVVNNDEFFARVEEVLAAGRQATIPVKGYSMLPFIRGGKDLVVLQKTEHVAPGDIVLFHMGPKAGGRYVMHRILRLEKEGERTMAVIRGDGVLRNCERVDVNAIIARAETILRGGDRPVDPYAPAERRKVRAWETLRPLRRGLLFVYKRLPWNIKWVRDN